MMIHPTIVTLRRLRWTGMAKALEEQQGLPDCDRLSFDERLAMLVDREAVERDNAALAQRLRLAGLRQAACLEDLDYRTARRLDRGVIQALAAGRWLHEHNNVLILGPTARVGLPVPSVTRPPAAASRCATSVCRGCSTSSPSPASMVMPPGCSPASPGSDCSSSRLGDGQAHRRAAPRPDGGNR